MQSKNTTKTPQDVAQEQATDPELAFFQECAELAGMGLDEWMAYEPF